jgi:hypothetical protein
MCLAPSTGAERRTAERRRRTAERSPPNSLNEAEAHMHMHMLRRHLALARTLGELALKS